MRIQFKIDPYLHGRVLDIQERGFLPIMNSKTKEGFYIDKNEEKDCTVLVYEGGHDSFVKCLLDLELLYLNLIGYIYPIVLYHPDVPGLKWNESYATYIANRAPWEEVKWYFMRNNIDMKLLPSRFVSQLNQLNGTLV